MNRRNYQKELEAELSNIEKEGRAPTLFLHSCCAPCSSYVLEYLSRYFTITVFYYNPNISPASEYEERAREQERLIREMETVHPVRFLFGSGALLRGCEGTRAGAGGRSPVYGML